VGFDRCDPYGGQTPVLVHVRPVDPRSPEATALLAELSREIAAMYADRGDDGGAGFRLEEVEGPRAAFLIAFAGEAPVGCGALRSYDTQSGEVKRMYTAPAWRGRGIAGQILSALEAGHVVPQCWVLGAGCWVPC
jgi:GNAT superfamily N-acetyltransferase